MKEKWETFVGGSLAELNKKNTIELVSRICYELESVVCYKQAPKMIVTRNLKMLLLGWHWQTITLLLNAI